MCACGDIGDRMEGVLWLKEVLRIFPKLRIVYTPGNHEFYGSNLDVLPYDLMKVGQRTDRLYILDGQYVFKHTIDDIDFIGASLWTNFNTGSPAIMNLIQRGLNDYKYIRSSGDFKLITANRIMQEHCEQRKSIFKKLSKSTNKCVCVTHHAPLLFNGGHADGLSYGYCSDLTEWFSNANKLPEYWFSGHTHSSYVKRVEYPTGTVQFVSNQMGYPTEFNSGFTTSCVLEI